MDGLKELMTLLTKIEALHKAEIAKRDARIAELEKTLGVPKEGMLVRLKDLKEYHYGKGDVEPGELGTIVEIMGGDLLIDFPNHSKWLGLPSEVETV